MGNVNLDICEIRDLHDIGIIGMFYGIETLFGDGNIAKTVFKLNSNSKNYWLAVTEARWQASQPSGSADTLYSTYLYIENAYVEYMTQAFTNISKKYLYDGVTSYVDGAYQLCYYRSENQPLLIGCKKPLVEFQLNMVSDPVTVEDEVVHEIIGLVYNKRPVYVTKRLVSL